MGARDVDGEVLKIDPSSLVEAIAQWYPPVYESSMQDVARKR